MYSLVAKKNFTISLIHRFSYWIQNLHFFRSFFSPAVWNVFRPHLYIFFLKYTFNTRRPKPCIAVSIYIYLIDVQLNDSNLIIKLYCGFIRIYGLWIYYILCLEYNLFEGLCHVQVQSLFSLGIGWLFLFFLNFLFNICIKNIENEFLFV